jgi:beta-carotene 15,15'-dioxygenase
MVKAILLLLGVLLVLVQQYLYPIPSAVQYLLFFAGIVLLGVPHGAADLLVAKRNADNDEKSFSVLKFFVNYLGRLIIFGLILFLFPFLGLTLFIFFAAYHFGETDLHAFKIESWSGKFFVVSYGLVILNFIILNNFEEGKVMLELFRPGIKNTLVIDWLENNRFLMLALTFLLFLICAVIYFVKHGIDFYGQRYFFLQFVLMLFILYNLPMILGFTFYFVIWHSLLSLRNIINYLRKDNLISNTLITKNIIFYSSLAMLGVVILGSAGFMFVNTNTITVYIFSGLAVLTAPHMQIMHDMYRSITLYPTIKKV